ncbi:hypothetical protein ACFL4T_14080, partial [candidate division KSB1 bacterium]
VIFLDVDPSVALKRIEKRGEKMQVHETNEKLSKLQNAYRLTCKVIKQEFNIPMLVIDRDDTIENITLSAIDYIKIHLKKRDSNDKSGN